MARRIAKFHKVSFEQFLEGFMDSFGPIEEEKIKEAREKHNKFWEEQELPLI